MPSDELNKLLAFSDIPPKVSPNLQKWRALTSSVLESASSLEIFLKTHPCSVLRSWLVCVKPWGIFETPLSHKLPSLSNRWTSNRISFESECCGESALSPVMALFRGKWFKLEQKGTGPGARSSHAIAVVGQKAYVFGGEFKPRVPVDNKLHLFDLQSRTWSVVEATGDVPTPRVGVTMAAVGEIIYVFGGRDCAHKELNELYCIDTCTNKWTLLSSGASGPAHRSYHSMTADDQGVFVFGGCGDAGRLNDLWKFDLKNHKWVRFPSPGETCIARGGPGLAVSGGKIWVLYGFSGEELDDVHSFDLVNEKWANVDTTGEKPSARSVFSTVVVGRYIVTYGGEVDPSDQGHMGAGKFSGEVYALDTETGVWIRCEDGSDSRDHPGPRGWCAYSAGRLNGQEGLLVYGGNSPSNDRLEDIFFFAPGFD